MQNGKPIRGKRSTGGPRKCLNDIDSMENMTVNFETQIRKDDTLDSHLSLIGCFLSCGVYFVPDFSLLYAIDSVTLL